MPEKPQETPPKTQSPEPENAVGWMRISVLPSGDLDIIRTGDFEDLSWCIGLLENLKLRYALELNLKEFFIEFDE